MKEIKVKIDGRTERILLNLDRDLDQITAKHTAFANFDALLNAQGYRPSIYLGGKSKQAKRELLSLSFEYDARMAARHDIRRVFMGDWEVI